MTDFQKEVRDMKIKEITERTVDAYNALVIDGNVSTRTIPEQVFVNNFLPYFSGEKKLEDNPTVIDDWVTIAGSPMASVNVVKPDGSVSCRVPPMMDTNTINVNNHIRGKNLKDIANTYELHKSNIPAVADKYLLGALEERFKTMKQDGSASTVHQNEWDAVLEHYGKKTNTPKTNQSTQSNHGDDDLIYE